VKISRLPEKRSSFIVNGITEIWQHIAGAQCVVKTSRRRRRRDPDIRSAAAAVARRSVTIGGGGVSKMSAAAARRRTALLWKQLVSEVGTREQMCLEHVFER